MATEAHVLSLEASTTSAKCILYSEDRGVISSRTKQFPPEVCDIKSQDPGGMTDAAYEVLASCAADAREMGIIPVGLGLVGTWHSLLLLDAGSKPLGRIRTWADLSGAEAANRARGEGRLEDYYLRTGCVLHGMYPSLKLAAMRDSKSPELKAASKVATQVEWLYRSLTGEDAVSACIASGSGLLDVNRLKWDDSALEMAGIDEGMLSPLRDIFHMGTLSASASRRTGLPAGLPVSVGGADGAMNQVAVGGFDRAIMSMSVGTSGALRRASSAPMLAERPSTWCYNISDDAWIAGAAINNATNCVDWLVALLGCKPGDESSYTGLESRAREEKVEKAPLFMPFLFGERCPGWREDRTGGLVGLSSGHSAGSLYRSVLEGVVFNLLQCYEIMVSLSGPPSKVIASGGITRSEYWMQMASDAFGIKLETTGAGNDSTVGAALVALAALKGHRHIHAPAAQPHRIFEPDAGSARLLRERYARYLEIYDAMAPKAERMSEGRLEV